MAADPVTTLVSIRDNYLAALELDSLNPRLDYSLDGQTVSRTQWRESLLKQVSSVQEVINALSPYEIQTVVI